jgi:hypothetical protein
MRPIACCPIVLVHVHARKRKEDWRFSMKGQLMLNGPNKWNFFNFI